MSILRLKNHACPFNIPERDSGSATPRQVILLVDTRKFFCYNPVCPHKTFAKRHPFAAPKAKKTDRLVKNIIHTSTQLSSLNASRLLKSGNITACKSSICSLLKKMPSIVDKASVKRSVWMILHFGKGSPMVRL